MKIKRFLTGILTGLLACGSAFALSDTLDPEGYPVMYVRGTMTDGWSAQDAYKFTRTDNTYTLSLPSLDGEFKIAGDDWQYEYGSENPKTAEAFVISDAATVIAKPAYGNFKAVNLSDVTLTFELKTSDESAEQTILKVSANGHEAPEQPEVTVSGLSGTLPVLYINVYTDETHAELNDEIIDRNLAHKNYFSNAEYWLDLNGCEWMEAEGAASLGSKDAPLPLEIKARGNFTRTAFSKKPYKLKLGKKQELLGLSKSKHFALIAHADDNFGYLRNFTGFNLGRRIGLPWTPWQQPVEVVINGNYRGLYFLTESIRIEKDRVNITELDDLAEEPALISGGYLVELDNYDEENQIQMEEKGCVEGYRDMLRVTWDTPEEYSDIQKRFITDQFTAMNDAVGVADKSNDLWKYMDMDDAVRYYLVEELISHVESYHGSTYLFRDRGEGQKWHYSPLWDCGNGFNGPTDGFLYNNSPFGNTWIASIRTNEAFNNRLRDTWAWFMNNGFKGIEDDMRAYAEHIKAAARADRERWKNEPLPNNENRQPVVDNSDMDSRLNAALGHLTAKAEWLKGQFGDYTQNPGATEPQRDATPAEPLPYYASENAKNVTIYFADKAENPWEQVYAYVWGGPDFENGTNDEFLGKWPGTLMTPSALVVDGNVATAGPVMWELSFFPLSQVTDDHKVIFHGGNGTTQTDSFILKHGAVYDNDGQFTGVENVEIADEESQAAYYNLQGVRIDAPRAGETYIRVSGDKASKVRL